MGICDGRVAVITGAGRGIGRGHALALAAAGAMVVANDLGVDVRGSGPSPAPASVVVDEIRAGGGRAVVSNEDVSDWDGAARVVEQALDEFGGLDVVVNNAGILRDRMLVNMTLDDWEAVLRVHLTATFATTRHAAQHWRARAKAGDRVDARVINTVSAAGLYGNIGQSNYGAAKAGIAAFTIIAAKELAHYGATVNAIAPGAHTRMSEQAGDTHASPPSGAFDERDAANIAPLVVWLASHESSGVTGRVFNVRGGRISVAEGWHAGPVVDKDGRWDAADLGAVIPGLVARAAPAANLFGETGDWNSPDNIC